MKKRILVCGEASWLSTGFAVYSREMLTRLHATGKFELAEFGSYGATGAPQAQKLPWKFYGNLPTSQREADIYKSKPTNQFGAYKFDAVVADFQPDIVFDVRDPWMFEHVMKSQFRGLFKTVLTPTVDSAPQRKEWVEKIFKASDVITAYSRYGKRVLEGEGVDVLDVTSPGVNLDLFKPMDKQAVRQEWGFKGGLFIIGTVMRNQKRKCFPQLFEAYAKLRKKYAGTREVEKSVLLCHTSWPDVGWDIPELIQRTGIQRHVIFTYKCDACTQTFFSWFLPAQGKKGMGKCIFCGEMKAHMPNTHSGVSEEELAQIFNLMDIYVQPAICEGWALPIVEAKACAVPGLYSNYSAMEDHVENGGGKAIDIGTFYTEPETMAVRSLPSVDSLVNGLKFLLTNSKKRRKLGEEARAVSEKMHDWQLTADKFIKIFDELEVHDRDTTWNRRPLIKPLPGKPPQGLSDEQFIQWCYLNYLDRPPEQKGFMDWMASLQKGESRASVEAFFRNKIYESNMFETIRWKNSVKIAGLDPNDNVALQTNVLPGGLV